MIAIYTRQSLDKKDSISIETQIEKCVSLCNGEDYVIYQDKGFSGKNTERPNFQAMMNDIYDGKVECVIAYRLDRISRSIADFSQLIQTFEKYNVNFMSATENFDTKSPIRSCNGLHYHGIRTIRKRNNCRKNNRQLLC